MLKGSSVTLEPLTSDEDYELLARWISSVAGTYAGGGRAFVNSAQFRDDPEASRNTYLIVRLHDGRPVGAVAWHTLEHPLSFQIGVMIGDTALWGGGLGVEAINLLLEYLFHSCNARRVQFIQGSFNRPAIEIACSGVARVEGVLRDYYFLDGAYHDAIISAILRDSYYAMRRGSGPPDVVSADEKDQARKILNDYLEKHPITLD